MRNNVPNITRAGKEIIKKETAASTITLVESKVIVTTEEQKTISTNIVKEKKSFIATLISDNLVSQAMRSRGKAALIKNETFITVAKDQEFITEEYIRQRFDTLNLSEYLKLYTPRSN